MSDATNGPAHPAAATGPDAGPAHPAPVPPKGPSGRFRDAPRRDIWIGVAIAGLFFVILLGWAAAARLDAGAYAQGQIVVSGNRQAVQHREGGVVSALNVKEGDSVRQGQVLVEISVGELRAVERGLAGQVVALQAQRARMIAERDDLPAVPTPPEWATLVPEDRPLASEALRLQRLQFQARGSGRVTQVGVLQQRIGQLNEQIQGLEGQIIANEQQKVLIGEELEGMRSLAARGFAPQTRVRALERAQAELVGNQGELRARVAAQREAIGETRLQILGVDRETTEEVADQLRQVEVQLNEAQPRLTATRDQIARAEVRAPASGQVVGLSIFTVGGVVSPGQTLMEIVPTDANLVVEALINPTEVDSLRVGQTTEVMFNTFREQDMPRLQGRLTRLSADSFRDEQSGRSFFRGEVTVPRSELEKLGPGEWEQSLRPGVPVEVVIPLRRRTALDYLLEPLSRHMWRSFRD